MNFTQLRRQYHLRICKELLRIKADSKKEDYPNNADGDSKISVRIAWEIVKQLCSKPIYGSISGQRAGSSFQEITKEFIEKTFQLLHHIRPGKWIYSINTSISNFSQYQDLAVIEEVVKESPELTTTLGTDYIVSPDIVIGREPEPDKEINKNQKLVRVNAFFS
ncbi:NgoMIV family type II restriction endonuclease [bacterium]|nr:NgoMIV family type II restriction endonuclease [bacterium]